MRDLFRNIRQSAAFLLIAAMLITGTNLPVYAAQETIFVETEDADAVMGSEETDAAAKEAAGEDTVEKDTVENRAETSADTIAEELTGGSRVTAYDYIPEGNLKVMKAVMDSRGRVQVSWKKFNGSKYYELYRYVSDYDGKGNEGFKSIFPVKTKKKSYRYNAYDYSASYIYKVVGYTKEGEVCGAYSAVCTPYALTLESRTTGDVDADGCDQGNSALTFTFAHSRGSMLCYEIQRASTQEKKENVWNVIDELQAKEAQVSSYNGEKIKTDSVNAVYYQDRSFTPVAGEYYYYKVSAYVMSSNGEKVYSGISKTLRTKVSLPSPYKCNAYAGENFTSADNGVVTGNVVSVVFNRMKGAESYEIYSSTKPKTGYKKVASISEQDANSKDHWYCGEDGKLVKGWCAVSVTKRVKPETNMYYRVRAVSRNEQGKKVYSAMSDYDDAMTHLMQITDLMAEPAGEENYIEVSFTPVSGADKYYVDRRIYVEGNNTRAWSMVACAKGDTRGDGYRYIVDKKNLQTNKVYEYRVRPACGKLTCTHTPSDRLMTTHITCTEAAARFTVSAISLTTVKVKWEQNKTSVPDAYKLEYGLALNDKNEIISPHKVTIDRSQNSTYFKGRYYLIKEGLIPFRNVYVRYCPVVDGEEQTWSEIKSAMPKPRAITGVTAVYSHAGEGAKLTWDESRDKEVDRYVVERSTSRNFDERYTKRLTGANGTTACRWMDEEEVSSGKTYYYRVAGLYYDSETNSYREGIWSSVKFSKPKEISVIYQNGSNTTKIENGKVYEHKKGFSGTYQIEYLDTNGDKFSPTVSKLTWGTNSGWATITAQKDSEGNHKATIHIDSDTPAGAVIEFWVYTENHSERDGLYKHFYIKVK